MKTTKITKLLIALMITTSTLGCLKPATSILGEVSSPAVAPPPVEQAKSRVVSVTKSRLSAGSLGEEDVEGVVCENGVCRMVSPKQVDSSKNEKTQPQSIPVTSVANTNNESLRWYTADKSQYYLPVEGNPTVFRNFNAQTNAPTNFYFDKERNKMAEFATFNGFDEKKAGTYYDMENIDPSLGTWKGVQKNQDNTNTGLSFFYGQQPNSTSHQQNYVHAFEIDPLTYQVNNQNSSLAAFLYGINNNNNQKFYTNQLPWEFDSQKQPTEQVSSIDQFVVTRPTQSQNNFVSQPIVNPIPVQSNQVSQVSQNQQSGRTGQLREILISGIGCGACPPARNDARSRGVEIQEVSMSSPNRWGVTSFPTFIWVDEAGNRVK